MATYRSAMSPWALCLIVLVAAGLVVSVWAVDSDSEADYNAWLAAHKALFEAKQLVATQSTKGAPIGAPAAPPAASGPSVVGPGPVGPPIPCSRTVGPKGSGATYTTATAAIKSIPAGGTQRFVICFAAGTYT
jgi:pectin methylesterase-like acyl-CoA thioesterase